MARIVLFAVAWVGTVVGAWFLGGGGQPVAPSIDDIPSAGDTADREPKAGPHDARTPALEGREAGAGRESQGSEGSLGVVPSTPSFLLPMPSEPVTTLDLDNLGTGDEAMGRLMAYAKTMLGQGEKGHLELLATFGKLIEGKKLEALFGSEESAVRYLYPWLKFLVQNDLQVAGMTETVFRVMAERPQDLAGLDDDVLEIFTEGFSMALPAVLPEDRLERLRGWARQIAAAPEDGLPKSLQGSRKDVVRALAAWAPPLTPDQAFERLRSGEIPPMEALALLPRLTPERLAEIDVVAILGPLIEQGEWRAMRMLRTLNLDARSLSALDQHVYAGASPDQYWMIGQYLQMSGRDTWPKAQAFVEGGLRRGGRTTEGFARALGQLHDPPPAQFVADVLRSYDLPQDVQTMLRGRFRLQQDGTAPR